MTNCCTRALPVSVLLALMVLGRAGYAHVTTDIDVPVAGPVGPAVRAHVLASAERYGAAGAQVKVHRVIPIFGGAVVKLQQVILGQPVENAHLSAVVQHNKIIAISGVLLQLASGRVVDGLRRKQAISAAGKSFPGTQALGATKVYYADGTTARPAWGLDLVRDQPFGSWRVVLDARTGQVLSSVSTMISASGKVYGSNPKVSNVVKVDLKGLSKTTELTGAHADVSSSSISSGMLYTTRYASPDTAGDYLYSADEPSFKDPFAEVQAYYHVDTFHRWMNKSFGFARIGTDQQIDVFVNYHTDAGGTTTGVYNAFFGDLNKDGHGDLVFGQGNRDFAYDADVIYHEFTHSAVAETSMLRSTFDTLGYNMMPGALNEAFADLFSCAFTGDEKVGEYAGGSKGPIRNLLGVARCPDSMSGETHADGLMWGQAVWAVRTSLADTTSFDAAVYKTMVGLTPNASLADAAALLLKLVASDTALSQKVQAELKKRGLNDCTRIVPLKENSYMRGYMMGAYGLSVMPGPMQYKIDVPKDATKLEITVKGLGYAYASIGAYIRKGSTVGFSASSSAYDLVKANNQASITLTTKDASKPLEPGATYYVLPLSVGKYRSIYQISMALTLPTPSTPDAAPLSPDAGPPPVKDSAPAMPDSSINPIDDAEASGCSCDVTGAPPASPIALLLLVAALRLRRRRSASP